MPMMAIAAAGLAHAAARAGGELMRRCARAGRRGSSAAAVGSRAASPASELDRRVLEHLDHRHVGAERVSQAVLDLRPSAASARRARRSCRGRRPARRRAPRAQIAAIRPFEHRRAGPTNACPARAAPASGLGQRAAVQPCRWGSAAAPRSGTKADGHHVLGQPFAAGNRRSSACPGGLRSPVRDEVGDQPRSSPGRRSRATTTASRTRGCSARTASISPSSMRKPRSFTWWSSRPRYSMAPSPRPPGQVAGPVQARRRGTAPNGSGMNRSAVRPGRLR